MYECSPKAKLHVRVPAHSYYVSRIISIQHNKRFVQKRKTTKYYHQKRQTMYLWTNAKLTHKGRNERCQRTDHTIL